jgi:phosphomannomutase
MARTGAVFGGEHSAHYYFRDFWGADTGMLAALHTLALLGGQAAPLSALAKDYDRYAASGEINSTVTDTAAKMAEVEAAFPVEIDRLDGITLTFPDGGWANVRPSNTEPLLRLNVEAPTAQRMAELRDEMLAVIRR